MKRLNITYWIVTIVISGFMLFSAIPDALSVPEALKFLEHLGYPNYFVPFIGVAKILGVLGILIPGFPRIKEWAYAGLFFDLVGATYSFVLVDGVNSGIVFMGLTIAVLLWSYYLHHKRLALKTS